jgi:hypothetical protein
MSRGVPFQPGNKFGRGRPKGSGNKTRSNAELLLEKSTEALMQKSLVLALRGSPKMLPWCLDHALKLARLPKKFKLPPIKTVADIARASDKVLNAVANGTCTEARGQALMAMLAERRKMFELVEVESRVEKIEQKLKPE